MSRLLKERCVDFNAPATTGRQWITRNVQSLCAGSGHAQMSFLEGQDPSSRIIKSISPSTWGEKRIALRPQPNLKARGQRFGSRSHVTIAADLSPLFFESPFAFASSEGCVTHHSACLFQCDVVQTSKRYTTCSSKPKLVTQYSAVYTRRKPGARNRPQKRSIKSWHDSVIPCALGPSSSSILRSKIAKLNAR